MWILENAAAFDGRRLWLRPGKTYLFGRTVAEPGQLAISHNTISRKHLTITVDEVENGHAHNVDSRSKLTIEDLATKIGTVVNGTKIKGKKHVLDGDSAEVMMGKCPKKFSITWVPMVFTFSFTGKELQKDPLATLRERFEQLDVRLLTDYAKATTHVISKKRNTAKGLQALINASHVVNEYFLDAVAKAASPPEGADPTDFSPLEQDFDGNWPDAMQYLPPRGGEPVEHLDSIYAPDPGRSDVFDGYTFIFYDKSQYSNLLAAITSGGGKALLCDVVPEQTQVDDFVQFVKNVAGEKGLGAFDDGSEGKGVVLVRYLPSKGSLVDWYAEFITTVSLRLDHRPIEQNEFLEAVLIKDASILRRSLEVESAPNTQDPQATSSVVQQAPAQPEANQDMDMEPAVPEKPQPAPRARTQRAVKRRFAGFDNDADIDMDGPPPAPPPAPEPQEPAEEGLFVSQEPDNPLAPTDERTTRRKRRGSPLPQDDLMDGMAPAAAKFKRQRLERGETLDEPEPEPAAPQPQPQPQPKKIKKEFDILAMAAQNREQEEARARAEREDLAHLPDDVDLAEIRRLNIVEEMEVRQPASQIRTRDQDVSNGRWNPKWNGMKNFKKFRQRGEVTGRPPTRVIVPLTEVKTKEFGVGDDYWLEDEATQNRKKGESQPSGNESQTSAAAAAPPPPPPAPKRDAPRRVVVSDSSDGGEEDPQEASAPAPGTRAARASASQSQSVARTQSSRASSQGSKRAAPEPVGEQPPKRQQRAQRPTRKVLEIANSDDSDEELKFKFGKRR